MNMFNDQTYSMFSTIPIWANIIILIVIFFVIYMLTMPIIYSFKNNIFAKKQNHDTNLHDKSYNDTQEKMSKAEKIGFVNFGDTEDLEYINY